MVKRDTDLYDLTVYGRLDVGPYHPRRLPPSSAASERPSSARRPPPSSSASRPRLARPSKKAEAVRASLPTAVRHPIKVGLRTQLMAAAGHSAGQVLVAAGHGAGDVVVAGEDSAGDGVVGAGAEAHR